MTRPPIQSLDDIMREEEERRLAETRAEMAAEKVEWDAKTPEEQRAHIEAVEAKFGRAEQDEPEEVEPCAGCGDPDCDFDCDGDYDGDGDE